MFSSAIRLLEGIQFRCYLIKSSKGLGKITFLNDHWRRSVCSQESWCNWIEYRHLKRNDRGWNSGKLPWNNMLRCYIWHIQNRRIYYEGLSLTLFRWCRNHWVINSKHQMRRRRHGAYLTRWTLEWRELGSKPRSGSYKLEANVAKQCWIYGLRF